MVSQYFRINIFIFYFLSHTCFLNESPFNPTQGVYEEIFWRKLNRKNSTRVLNTLRTANFPSYFENKLQNVFYNIKNKEIKVKMFLSTFSFALSRHLHHSSLKSNSVWRNLIFYNVVQLIETRYFLPTDLKTKRVSSDLVSAFDTVVTFHENRENLNSKDPTWLKYIYFPKSCETVVLFG